MRINKQEIYSRKWLTKVEKMGWIKQCFILPKPIMCVLRQLRTDLMNDLRKEN